ncbi:Cytochrome C oxidase, mono-heme subunit/FixO [compost metagenome]
MPSYKWLFDNEKMDYSEIKTKMEVMVKLGVPYTKEEIENAMQSIEKQAMSIEKNLYTDPDFRKSYEESRKAAALKGDPFIPMHQREIIPMIAYLQRMGTDIKVKESK